jgi:hypothetical protein
MMKKKTGVSDVEIKKIMAEEILEKFQRSTSKILDWGEAMEKQERNLSDPQDFGRIIYAKF